MANILDRVALFAQNEGITIGSIEKTIGASKGVLSRALAQGTDVQAKWIKGIVENYPSLSPDWLLTGTGDMLRSSVTVPTERQPRDDRPKTNELRRNYEGASDHKRLPLVTQKAVAGFGNADFAIREEDVKDYYVVPKFRYHQVDFMIEISGSSMYPKYNSGDVVACTILHDGSFIQWNKCHIVATREQGILCKRLMPGSSDDCLKMVSDNENYPPFEVPKEEITGIALVVGVIRLE